LKAEIKYSIRYSARKTLAISILADSSVIIRAPYRTSGKTIASLVQSKELWILKHTERIRSQPTINNRGFAEGDRHLFRGVELELRIHYSGKRSCLFRSDKIEISTPDQPKVERILKDGYKAEAYKVFPEVLKRILHEKETYGFRVTALRLRTMKSRWGSCSRKGVITLNTELIKLEDKFLEYVILHELCHLRHHNHGTGFYVLLSELYPSWKETRKELKKIRL
jgi:predicted metal-dependent hydrolase